MDSNIDIGTRKINRTDQTDPTDQTDHHGTVSHKVLLELVHSVLEEKVSINSPAWI